MQYWQRKLQRAGTEMRTSPIARPWPSTSGAQASPAVPGALAAATGFASPVPVPRLAAGLVEQRDLLDDDALLDALDHVVDGERADRRGRQGLHLDARPGHGARLRDERDRAGVDVRADV